MTLIEKINTDFMVAYKAKNMDEKNFLGVLKTEVSKETKTPEDSFIVGKIKAMIKNAATTNSLSELELTILEGYLPSQLTETDLESIVEKYLEENEVNSMGQIMGHLKTNYGGQYDGKMASTLVKTFL